MTGGGDVIEARGQRITWPDLPAEIRQQVERRLGGPVVEARSQAGGFSPGTADRVRTSAGRRAFVKAVSTAINTRSVEMARIEARVTALLPASVPAPRLLDSYDDGVWTVLILEDVDGRQPRTPWEEPELDAAVRMLEELARTMTPAPLGGLPTAAEQLAGNLGGWDEVTAEPPPDLEPWVTGRVDALRAAGERARHALSGQTLTHYDVRADNILIRPDGSVVLVDWPWACTGPPWLDRALLGLNVLLYGGDPEPALRGIDEHLVIDLYAGLAGFFLHRSRLPSPGLPTVRAFQRAQADVLVSWLRGRLTL